MNNNEQIAFIGGGHLTTFMLSGLINHGYAADKINVCDRHHEKRLALKEKYHVHCFDNIKDAISNATMILLSVKPNGIQEVCQTLAPIINNKLVISLAAGISINDISQALKNQPIGIIRSMTNLATQVGQATTVLIGNQHLTDTNKYQATDLFNQMGSTTWLNDENELNAYSPLVGSGPGFIFYFLEALQEAAIAHGVCKQHAKDITIQITKGAIELIKTTHEPISSLREKVTTKNGITAAGLTSLSDNQYKEIITQAYLASKTRCQSLESNETD